MDSIKIDIRGARLVGLRFDEFPDALYEDLHREIDALTIELFARVQAATPRRTGELAGAEGVKVFADPDHIKGNVYIAGPKVTGGIYSKAGALEYGAHRATMVSTHFMLLDHYWALKLAEPDYVLVDAYERIPNIEEYAFERGPLAEMAPEITARLNAVVEAAVAKANA